MAQEKKTVYFGFAKNTLGAESKEKLQGLLKIFKEYPDIKIQLTGHTDNVGNEPSNKLRGFDRANAVKTFLVNNGISERAFLKLQSEGELRPIQSNETPKGRSKNRRVEVAIK